MKVRIIGAGGLVAAIDWNGLVVQLSRSAFALMILLGICGLIRFGKFAVEAARYEHPRTRSVHWRPYLVPLASCSLLILASLASLLLVPSNRSPGASFFVAGSAMLVSAVGEICDRAYTPQPRVMLAGRFPLVYYEVLIGAQIIFMGFVF